MTHTTTRLLALVILLALCMAAHPSEAQQQPAPSQTEELFRAKDNVSQTPTFMPSQHYLVRVVLFTQDARRGGVVFLGDSLTEGWLIHKEFQEHGLRNRGIGGDTTFGLLMRLHEIVQEKPEKIFIMIGVNDLIKNELHGLIQRYEHIVNTLGNALPGAEIFIQSILPVNWEDFPQASQYVDNDKILTMNKRLEELARRNGLEYLDLAPRFTNRAGNLKKALSIDGIHINEKGYDLWFSLIKDRV
ncbi:MAG: GDSL-type esterase/lipase family protein [Oceanidesulfovibrio sp.]